MKRIFAFLLVLSFLCVPVLADDLALLDEDLGMELTVAHQADSVFAQDTYVVVGLCHSPQYLNIQRGTTALGNGSVSGFLYLTREEAAKPAAQQKLTAASPKSEMVW